MKSDTVVPPRERKGKAANPCVVRRILVPVDFSAATNPALRYATRFAESFGATVYPVYVIESIGALKEAQIIGERADMEAAKATMRAKLAELANEEIEELVPVFPDVEEGRPAEKIVALARKHRADLLIISTHGRTGLKHTLMGSVAEEVVRRAPCPVLVVRSHEQDFA